ncbi:MAG: 23S rRNA (adenine(2503)-C(2))-methyltransferase RlmN, partial [Verrucomicrobiae bacterium]|nr:23S rRNA (adenine(2503)-C(2))-methyltransferase RlmN [Verrucomicrobiae bacterium]MDW7981160.1 23S rRNA (adenine(2503)-C(2))-methyltransferase RlmN [Verrucomicrobiales bacterium]
QFRQLGEPEYRVTQLLQWLYQKRVADWDAMTNLPAALRATLRGKFSLAVLRLRRSQTAQDGTIKLLWELPDGAFVECVLIPASPALYGQPSDRRTLCISTQVGCAFRCRFCASGLRGLKRNLRVEEIVEQVVATEREFSARNGSFAPETVSESEPYKSGKTTPRAGRVVDNLVLMGMGEPLANYENVLKALRILNAPWGGGIGARKITISTCGLPDQIRRLADEPYQFRLAVSLHGATDAVRNRLMPVNRKFPLKELMAACRYYRLKKGKMITFEYVLINGVNDSLDQAELLAGLARELDAKINLIPFNRVEGLPWEAPSRFAQVAFFMALKRLHPHVTLRREKGAEIDAACGQLRLKTERELERPDADE